MKKNVKTIENKARFNKLTRLKAVGRPLKRLFGFDLMETNKADTV